MSRDFKEMRGNSQPQMFVYWFFNYRKMKYMLEKHDAWHGAMVWPYRALVKIENVWLMSSCTPFINLTITKEV